MWGIPNCHACIQEQKILFFIYVEQFERFFNIKISILNKMLMAVSSKAWNYNKISGYLWM